MEADDMQAQVRARLAELRSEFEAGQRMLADLDARRGELQQTLLRIGGAVQVLEELLGAEPDAEGATEPANGRTAGAGVG